MRALLLVTAALLVAPTARAQTLGVVSLAPPINASNVSPSAAIVVDFDRPVNPASLPPSTSHFTVAGHVSGPTAGTFALENGNQRLRFTPAAPFAAGEVVMAELDHFVQAQDGSFVRPGGWSWSFRVRAGPALRSFTQIDSMTVRSIPTVSARVYGGGLADFDEDGFVDIAAVCEDSSDVRVFRNRADGTGLFHPFLVPTNPVGTMPSPNDPADMNGDGKLDHVTCNTASANVSVLPGNGNCTFGPRTDWAMGSGPHGLALLDADGDGDLDVATSNTGSSNVSLILNNGAGAFSAPTFFEGGGSSEYALCAVDMNNDGMTDLVVGARASQLAIVHLSNGNGTFTAQPGQSAGGQVWMMMAGDVNNDGKMDVTCANSSSGNGAVLRGNGAGGFSSMQTVPAGSNAVATDLGDLDGDGDLDWVLSCFGGSVFEVYVNNGAGTFSHDQSFPALANASCAGMVDIDNDRDLDLLLFDEIADFVTVMRNLNAPIQDVCQPGVAGVIPCPCGNPSAGAPLGCQNSAFTGGAAIFGSGAPSLSADTLVFTTHGETANATSIVLQGSAIEPRGVVFGQGVRCTAGALKRLYVKTALGGAVTAPQAGDPSVSTRSAALGSPIVAGQHRWYSVYYRDPVVPGVCPAASTFNTTATLSVSWAP